MMNWRDNPWWSKGLEQERLWDFEHRSRAEYDHIWEGKFNDTVEGSIIKAEWFDAAIDAHIKLGFEPRGFKIVSHDPSDTGPDPKGLYYRHGSVVMDVQEKTDGDVNDGCDWATEYAINVGADMFTWDCDGLGIGLQRQVMTALDGKKIAVNMFKGSKSPINPKSLYQPDTRLNPGQAKSNQQTFKNRRAQYYIRLRDRFYNAYRAVVKGDYVDPDQLISVSSSIECLHQFRSEVCRIPKKNNPNGLIQIMDKPEMKRLFKIESPNLADSAMMGEEIPQPIKDTKKIHTVPTRSRFGHSGR